MTDDAGHAGEGAYDLPPYDPYAGWDAPAPYEQQRFEPPVAPQPTTPLTLLPPLPADELPAAGITYELASFGQRARAMSIDTLILMIPTGLVLAFILPSVLAAAGRDPALAAEVNESTLNAGAAFGSHPRLMHWGLVAGIVITVVYWAILALYSGWFMSRTGGQTPGRRAAGVRVMREEGRPVTFGWAVYRTVLVREIAFTVASLATFGLATMAQYGWSLWDHERRSLHDMVTRSRVVVDASGRKP